MRKLDDNLCNHCGLTGYWSRIYCTPKYFVDLYQAFIKGKDKNIVTHLIENGFIKADVEVNNALCVYNPLISLEKNKMFVCLIMQ